MESVDSVEGSALKLKPDVHEAYVTFVRSEDAYNAFIENRNETKSAEELITVLPVDTWKVSPVPKKEDELLELTRRISDIDEKGDPLFIFKLHITPQMLLKVFRSLLRISKEFLSGLDLRYELHDESESSDESDSSDDETEDLETTDDSLVEKVSPTISKKEPNESNEESSSADESRESENDVEELNCIQDHEFEKRLSEVLTQNLGQKFEILTIRKDIITRKMLQWFAPVLKQLHRLVIYTVSDCSILYALHEYCPNVCNFHLESDEWFGEFDQVPIEAWPSLKELYLKLTTLNDDENANEGNKKFQRFIELNPQITAIQIESAVDLDTLSTIGRTLHDLNTLAFVRNSFERLNSVLDNLCGLSQLCGLKMSALEVEKSDLNGLSKLAKRLSRLPRLQLITIFLNCEPKTEKDEDFDHLNEFRITHHHDCECHGPNRILSFQDQDIEIPDESSVLVVIVNTIPAHRSADKTLESDILSAIKKTTKFFPNIIENIELEGANNHVYMQISSDKI